jgi:hypothetical protein
MTNVLYDINDPNDWLGSFENRLSNKERKAMKCALNALEHVIYWDNEKPEWEFAHRAIVALKDVLAIHSRDKCVCGEPNSSAVHRTDGPCYSKEEKTTTWRPIETAPKDNKRPLYLAVFDGRFMLGLDYGGLLNKDGEWRGSKFFRALIQPTHWAYQDEPIPQVPSEEKKSVVLGATV